MKSFVFSALVLLAACVHTLPTTVLVNPDLPQARDKMVVVLSEEGFNISVDTNRIDDQGDVKFFSGVTLLSEKITKGNGPMIIVTRLAINCKENLIKELRIYRLDGNSKVIGTKTFQKDFGAIEGSSLGEKAYPVVCGKPFHESVTL